MSTIISIVQAWSCHHVRIISIVHPSPMPPWMDYGNYHVVGHQTADLCCWELCPQFIKKKFAFFEKGSMAAAGFDPQSF